LPGDTYGPWQTVYERFNRWSKGGTWGRLLVRLNAAGKIDRELLCIDGPDNHCRAVARGDAGRGSDGTDPLGGPGGPSAAEAEAAGQYQGVQLSVHPELMTTARDQGGDPYPQGPEAAPTFDKATYRRRNVVERCIGWLMESRRLATRFENLAENFLAMVTLAMLERLLKSLLPDRP
jgi:transposase